jgi:hypothetical protein
VKPKAENWPGKFGTRDRSFSHEIADVEWARAAERHEHEIARVEALFGQHGMKRAHHVVVGDPHNGERSFFHR